MRDEEFRCYLLSMVGDSLRESSADDANKVRRYLEFNPTMNSAPIADLCWAICYLAWRREDGASHVGT